MFLNYPNFLLVYCMHKVDRDGLSRYGLIECQLVRWGCLMYGATADNVVLSL